MESLAALPLVNCYQNLNKEESNVINNGKIIDRHDIQEIFNEVVSKILVKQKTQLKYMSWHYS
jgi:hypothetical protein